LRLASGASAVDACRCREHSGSTDDSGQDPLERDAGRAAGVD